MKFLFSLFGLIPANAEAIQQKTKKRKYPINALLVRRVYKAYRKKDQQFKNLHIA
jgi:hypothetical protein